jgi:hypothetical protein
MTVGKLEVFSPNSDNPIKDLPGGMISVEKTLPLNVPRFEWGRPYKKLRSIN